MFNRLEGVSLSTQKNGGQTWPYSLYIGFTDEIFQLLFGEFYPEEITRKLAITRVGNDLVLSNSAGNPEHGYIVQRHERKGSKAKPSNYVTLGGRKCQNLDLYTNHKIRSHDVFDLGCADLPEIKADLAVGKVVCPIPQEFLCNEWVLDAAFQVSPIQYHPINRGTVGYMDAAIPDEEDTEDETPTQLFHNEADVLAMRAIGEALDKLNMNLAALDFPVEDLSIEFRPDEKRVYAKLSCQDYLRWIKFVPKLG